MEASHRPSRRWFTVPSPFPRLVNSLSLSSGHACRANFVNEAFKIPWRYPAGSTKPYGPQSTIEDVPIGVRAPNAQTEIRFSHRDKQSVRVAANLMFRGEVLEGRGNRMR